MGKKERKAKEYSRNTPTICYNEEGIKRAFTDGWEAAYDHLCEKPLDEMIEELSEYLKSKDNGKSE